METGNVPGNEVEENKQTSGLFGYKWCLCNSAINPVTSRDTELTIAASAWG